MGFCYLKAQNEFQAHAAPAQLDAKDVSPSGPNATSTTAESIGFQSVPRFTSTPVYSL